MPTSVDIVLPPITGQGWASGLEGIAKTSAADPPIAAISKEVEGIKVELAMWWNSSPREVALCFTNNIPQRDGGTHQAGFRQALTRVVMKYAEELAKKAPHYVRMAKLLTGVSLDNSITEHLQLERHGIADSMATEDLRKGVETFFSGGTPEFHGR